MGYPILVLGESGSGKTASLRNLDPAKTLIVQSINKRLPFRSPNWKRVSKEKPDGSVFVSDDYSVLRRVIASAHNRGKEVLIFDDANYLMTNESLRRVDETGFKKFTQMAYNFWQLIKDAQDVPGDMRIYFLAHVQIDNEGRQKIKTIGKMLDDQIVVEGLFTTVIGCHVQDGRHYFTTRNSGSNTVKTPIGMFEEEQIDNDLALVDQVICEYEDINSQTIKKVV